MVLSLRLLYPWRHALLAGILLAPLGLRAQSSTCMLVPVALGQRVQAAPLVVEARVASQQTEQTAGGGHISTRSQLEVFKVFKGQLPAGALRVRTAGGTLGLQREESTGTLHLTAGQQGVFFLVADPEAPGEWQAYAGPQGFIAYDLADLSAGDPFVHYPTIGADVQRQVAALAGAAYQEVQANPALAQATQRRAQVLKARQSGTLGTLATPVISGFSPAALIAGASTATTSSLLTINGSGFGNAQGAGYVQFRNANSPGPDSNPTYLQPLPSDYVAWSDNQIQVRVPSYSTTGTPAGTGFVRVVDATGVIATSANVLTVTYALSNLASQASSTAPILPYRPNLISPDGSGGYTLRYAPSFRAVPAAQVAFETALQSWQCRTAMNRTIGAATDIDVAARDNVNVVRFVTAASTGTNVLPAGVLGVTTSYFGGCQYSDGSIEWVVAETDYSYALASSPYPGYTWNFTPNAPAFTEFDFQSVALHEQGHGEQLTHIIDPTAVMNYSISNGQAKRTLSASADIAGGNDVISYSAGYPWCGLPPFVASTSGCALPVELTAFSARYQPGQGTQLSWATASELHSLAFIVESQDDPAAPWQDVARVAAAGSSPTPRQYAHLDARPLAGTRYYRLRQLDQDGTTAYSPVVSVAAEATALAAYPNPAAGTVQLVGPATSAAQVRLFDATGRCVRQAALPLGQGSLALSLAGVPAGLYVVEWRGGPTPLRTRLVVN
ncbi:T9SS type A sorting domain-containing protein [Hymenobacter sp. HMF4947]|uniref:T9SS type A sorting domain-containing protein n=1 Tax=Hymenobacter ginkgonis TaxID=2682976 RepID=A0A7K1TFV8_9BACT|nr:T9SS type A sorting domain-containing protein [Hymenobacter ginkgonis]MVN77290.1 T9SS type A sorting domain-containing protein [Hymenobacter ginkgonis]